MPRPSVSEGRGFCDSQPYVNHRSRTPPLKNVKDGAPKNLYRKLRVGCGDDIIDLSNTLKKKPKPGSLARSSEFTQNPVSWLRTDLWKSYHPFVPCDSQGRITVPGHGFRIWIDRAHLSG